MIIFDWVACRKLKINNTCYKEPTTLLPSFFLAGRGRGDIRIRNGRSVTVLQKKKKKPIRPADFWTPKVFMCSSYIHITHFFISCFISSLRISRANLYSKNKFSKNTTNLLSIFLAFLLHHQFENFVKEHMDIF